MAFSVAAPKNLKNVKEDNTKICVLLKLKQLWMPIQACSDISAKSVEWYGPNRAKVRLRNKVFERS